MQHESISLYLLQNALSRAKYLVPGLIMTQISLNKNHTPVLTLFISLSICLVGNSLYALSDNLPYSVYFVLLSRFLVGFSAGANSLPLCFLALPSPSSP